MVDLFSKRPRQTRAVPPAGMNRRIPIQDFKNKALGKFLKGSGQKGGRVVVLLPRHHGNPTFLVGESNWSLESQTVSVLSEG